MDTEFPGVVIRPPEDGRADMAYQTLRANCDALKLIQLGLSFTDSQGKFAQDSCTCWQFNFKFSLSDDIFAEDSIELLKQSGIDFAKFEREGVDVHQFGELLMMSGLVLKDDVRWLSFSSSYDFGYLIKTLTCEELPYEEIEFMKILHTFFPNVYDIKSMMGSVQGLYGGLSSLADTLQIQRIGPAHQAGSDSLLTSQTYFAFMKKHFPGEGNEERFQGQLFGLGGGSTYSAKFKGARSDMRAEAAGYYGGGGRDSGFFARSFEG